MQQTLLRENPQNKKRLPGLTTAVGTPNPGQAAVHPRANGGLADNIPGEGDDLPEEASFCRRDAPGPDLRATAMPGNARFVQAPKLHLRLHKHLHAWHNANNTRQVTNGFLTHLHESMHIRQQHMSRCWLFF